MAITIVSTPGAANANSFATQAEINTILAERIPLNPVWPTTGDEAIRRIITARYLIEREFSGRKRLVRPKAKDGGNPYYIIGRVWTGTIASDTQALSWGRIGMVDRYGRAIPDGDIPWDLKVAQAEVAGLLSTDRSLDNDIIIQGITKIKASSVELTFRDDLDFSSSYTLPQSVFDIIPSSWYTEERIEEVLAGRRARIWNL